jgi:hypothetical protein
MSEPWDIVIPACGHYVPRRLVQVVTDVEGIATGLCPDCFQRLKSILDKENRN